MNALVPPPNALAALADKRPDTTVQKRPGKGRCWMVHPERDCRVNLPVSHADEWLKNGWKRTT